jgi:hypothetical protein
MGSLLLRSHICLRRGDLPRLSGQERKSVRHPPHPCCHPHRCVADKQHSYSESCPSLSPVYYMGWPQNGSHSHIPLRLHSTCPREHGYISESSSTTSSSSTLYFANEKRTDEVVCVTLSTSLICYGSGSFPDLRNCLLDVISLPSVCPASNVDWR